MKKIITPLSPSASLLSLLWRMSPTFWSNPAGWCSSTSSPWTCSSQRFPQVWAELATCRPTVNNILLYFQWKMSDQWISAPDPASPSRTRTRTVWQVRSCWQAAISPVHWFLCDQVLAPVGRPEWGRDQRISRRNCHPETLSTDPMDLTTFPRYLYRHRSRHSWLPRLFLMSRHSDDLRLISGVPRYV